MASLVRSAKSGSDWTSNDLESYNIEVARTAEEEFFGVSANVLPPGLSSDILTYEYRYGEDVPNEVDKIMSYLDLASNNKEGQESMVDDFASRLLDALGYDSTARIIRTRHAIPFFTSGVRSVAQTDVCIMTRIGGLLLLLQEDKRLESSKDPEPQVVAEAIAAFQENNRKRDLMDMSPLHSATIPCITMVGTFPTFYLVPVTKDLNDCVRLSQYPHARTTVLKYIPGVPRRRSDGMKPIDNRRKILQCYEAFKRFVNELEQLLDS